MADAAKEQLQNRIENIYDTTGYGQQYGFDIWVTVIIILIFLFAIVYFYIIGHLSSIKADWPNNRCNPTYIPFASLINPPVLVTR